MIRITDPHSILTFDETNFNMICDQLASQDADLRRVLDSHQYPPLWRRTASFETLVHIILEQQVSLASALAAMNKLREKTGIVTPASLLALSNEELRACYFSRQKIRYTQHLASSIIDGELILEALPTMDNEAVRTALTKIKGIGNWTVDVYLMMVLQRCDLFPPRDVALMTSIKEVKQLPKETTREEIVEIAHQWKPYQTIAAFILWHAYLCKRQR